MAIDETGLTKGLVRKLNALRKSVGDDLAEEVFAKWLERDAASQAKSKPDPVAVKIVEALAGLENKAKFNLGNHGYTLRRAKGKARRASSHTRMKRRMQTDDSGQCLEVFERFSQSRNLEGLPPRLNAVSSDNAAFRRRAR